VVEVGRRKKSLKINNEYYLFNAGGEIKETNESRQREVRKK